MSFVQRLAEYSRSRRTLLCVGLDPDRNRIPEHLKKEKSFLSRFCCETVESVAPFCIAFKPNIAFFESSGYDGIRQFEETI
ncbi:MAG TPA: orotidine 5'-phosphate decarboxylase, partial [Leptospiraceae bacterium]|nr:orotidine 5'-phosphate decarboxylase [Leptospiraceae bacterium]